MNDVISELERAIEDGCGEYREVEVRVLKYVRARLLEQHAEIEILQEDIVASSRLIEEQMEASAKRHKSIMRDMAQVKRDLPLALANIRAKAITEFADRVCEGRVSNDPVVIVVRCAEREMKEAADAHVE